MAFPYQQNQFTPYQPFYPAYAMPTMAPVIPQQQQQTSAPRIKLDTVSGKTAADVYNVNIGEEVILYDIDNPVVYKKYRNMENKLEEQIFDLVPHIDKPTEEYHQINMDEYLKADAVEEIISERVKEEVEKRLSEISFTPKATRKTTKGDE